MIEQIKERAKAYVNENFDRIAEDMPIEEGMETIYIESAREQHKVDIEKACEWIMSVSKYDYVNCNEEFCKQAFTRDFREAMGVW